MACTMFEYLYRDAANFKAFGSIALEGSINDADREAISRTLDSGELFIAEQIGVPALYDLLYQWSDGPTAADHCWHEFVGLRELAEPSATDLSARELVARFAAVKEWHRELSPHFRLTEC